MVWPPGTNADIRCDDDHILEHSWEDPIWFGIEEEVDARV